LPRVPCFSRAGTCFGKEMECDNLLKNSVLTA